MVLLWLVACLARLTFLTHCWWGLGGTGSTVDLPLTCTFTQLLRASCNVRRHGGIVWLSGKESLGRTAQRCCDALFASVCK
eukprot:COSAG02_NODE_4888_length_4861_cov_5.325283_5_plen_81_part_00